MLGVLPDVSRSVTVWGSTHGAPLKGPLGPLGPLALCLQVYGADAAHQLAQSLKRNRALQVLMRWRVSRRWGRLESWRSSCSVITENPRKTYFYIFFWIFEVFLIKYLGL